MRCALCSALYAKCRASQVLHGTKSKLLAKVETATLLGDKLETAELALAGARTRAKKLASENGVLRRQMTKVGIPPLNKDTLHIKH